MPDSDYIFGYGSLVHVPRLKAYLGREEFEADDLFFCRLGGYRRIWNIAMDNRVNLPGYKYYVDSETGLRPDVYVTFLNIWPSSDDSIAGILFRVDAEQLASLDKRERNYRRVEITNLLDRSVQGRAWVYIGSPEAEQRFKLGFSNNTAVISQSYYDLVYEAYASLGEDSAPDYLATTDKPIVPLRNLKRIELT